MSDHRDPSTPEPSTLDPASAPTLDPVSAPTLDPASAPTLFLPGSGRQAGVAADPPGANAETLDAGSLRPGTSVPPGAPAEFAPEVGDAIDGRYVVLREIGHGGMGRVLLVRDERICREVALKCLLTDGAEPGSNRDSSASTRMRRFLREVQLSGQLEHPSIVPIHDSGESAGSPYYTMRYIQGRSLAEALHADPTPAGRLRLLPHFRDVCNAMAFAHDRKIIHRDLKPANVILGEYGETMVIDWGLAKVQGDADESDRRLAEELRQIQDTDDSQTVFGTAMGTPAYMAPEQALGQLDEIDHQSDIYSLGAILYELLTGVPPYSGGHPHRVMLRVVAEPLTPVHTRAPDAPAELAAIAEKALHKNKAKRYATCAELATDVSAWLSGEKVSIYAYSNWELMRRFIRRNRLAVAAAAIVLLALVGTAVFMTRAWRQEADARGRAQDARGREMSARLQEKQAREEEKRQKELAQVSLQKKIEEERTSHFRLAEAHLARAEHLFKERYFLEAGLHAAAASLNHPGNPRSPLAHPGFCKKDIACENLTARALGIFVMARQSTHMTFERMIPLDLPLNFDLYTRHRLHPAADGKHLIIVSNEKNLRIWDASTGRVTHKLAGHTAAICQAAFDATGARLVSVDQNGEWIFRAFPSGKEEHRLPSDLDTVFFLEPLSGTGDLIAGLMDGRLYRVDAAARTLTPLWPELGLSLQDIVISPTGRNLAIFDRRGVFRMYDFTTRSWTRTERRRSESQSSYGTFYASGEAFAFPDVMTNRLLVYDAPRWNLSLEKVMSDASGGEFYHSLVPYAATAGTRHGQLIAELSNSMQLVEGRDLKIIQNFQHHAPIGSVRSTDRRVMVLGGKSELLILTPTEADREAVLAEADGVIGLITPLDAHTTLAATWIGTTLLLDHRDRSVRTIGKPFSAYVWTADLATDRKTLAVGSWDNTIQILDYPAGTVRRELKLESPVTFVRFSADGKRLFAATFKMLHVLDTADWKTLDRHIIGVVSGNGPPVSESRRRIAFHETEEEISLFSLENAKLDAIKPAVKNLIEGSTRLLEPDELIVQDQEFCLYLIQPPDRKPRQKFCGMESYLATASVNRARTLLLVSGDDQTVRLWSIPDGRLLLVLPTIVGQVASFDFDQQHILFERGNRVWRIPLDATLWSLPAATLMQSAERQAGLCIDGAQLKPLHKCPKKPAGAP